LTIRNWNLSRRKENHHDKKLKHSYKLENNTTLHTIENKLILTLQLFTNERTKNLREKWMKDSMAVYSRG
jgi:hypothetical protein